MNDYDFRLTTIRGDRRVLRNRMRSIQEESESPEEEEEEEEEEEREDSYQARLLSFLTNGQEDEFVRLLAQCNPGDLDDVEVEESADSDDSSGVGDASGGGCAVGGLLQRAARAGLGRATAALVRAGADPNACSGGDAEPPLVAAARLGHDAVLHALLRAGASLKVDAADARGDTALHHAARAGRARAVALLLWAGADAGCRNRAGLAALGGAEATALLDFCVRKQDVQEEDLVIELDFGSLVPALEYSDDCNTKSPHIHMLPLQSEMPALHRLASTKHLGKELNHPIIHVFLEMKLCSMGALAYLNAEFHMVYNLFAILFSVSATSLSVDRDSKTTYKPMTSCISENESVTFLEEVFRPVCVENFNYDPIWFTVLGVSLFGVALILTICKIYQCVSGSVSAYFVFCLWYFNLLFISLRLITNHLRLPAYFFGHVPGMISSFILIEKLSQHPAFSYSINLFKLVSNKSRVFLAPYCAIFFGFILGLYFINIIVRTTSYLNDPQKIHIFEVPVVLLNALLIDNETIILSMKVFIIFVFLLALITLNTMMGLAVSKIEKVDMKLMRRVQNTQILFVMESERLIIFLHNCLVRLPCVPHWIIRFFKSAVLFSPEIRVHSCRAKWNNLSKVLIAELPNGRQCPLPIDLSDKVMTIIEENHQENLPPDVVTPDMLENELSDMEMHLKDRLSNLQNDLKTFIGEQNSLLKNLIKELNDKSQNSRHNCSDMKHVVPEQINVWQKQTSVYNTALVENINNSHANLQSGFSRLEKTLGEMMIQLDCVLKPNSEQNIFTLSQTFKDEENVLNA